jgi:hypothetical protein
MKTACWLGLTLTLLGAGFAGGSARSCEAPTIAWGVPQDGWQVGLELRGAPNLEARVGDALRPRVWVRNTTAAPVTLRLQAIEGWSAVLDADRNLNLDPRTGSASAVTVPPGAMRAVPGAESGLKVLRWESSEDAGLRLPAGKYAVRCRHPAWVADTEPNRATALRAGPGPITLNVLADGNTALDERVVRDDEGLAWGKPVNGLQLGIRWRHGKGRFKVGDTAELEAQVRNVTRHPLTFEVTDGSTRWQGGLPDVTTPGGDRVPVHLLFLTGLVQMTRHTVPPGKAVVLGHPALRVQAAEATNQPDLTPAISARPGRYRVTLHETPRPGAGGGFYLHLAAGTLDLEVAP